MSTVHVTAPRVPNQKSAHTIGSTAVGARRRNPLVAAVRNVGIALDTAARVVFLGRDGVGY